ncbi:transcriptional regulator with XRE-family HTH domain [Comamonas odontotermitis]|uniref:Transcriptional regulator with XRE-family HTH domain n=1 Tax=Comamonas odontotermitis TaxID=379895 RepID=A0ABR6RH20_9BURK|nr:helix-turn-helix domain-containing protein [Comamonas odontotermitis]MBB6578451.1 transcriptional regulator with XRE-family HTH domain [Comamonas odontotermitis]
MIEDRRQLFGARLREERKKLGFSQAEVAEFLNVARQSVSAWETGATCPSAVQLGELAALYCCCAHLLLFGEPYQGSLLRKLMIDTSLVSHQKEVQ